LKNKRAGLEALLFFGGYEKNACDCGFCGIMIAVREFV